VDCKFVGAVGGVMSDEERKQRREAAKKENERQCDAAVATWVKKICSDVPMEEKEEKKVPEPRKAVSDMRFILPGNIAPAAQAAPKPVMLYNFTHCERGGEFRVKSDEDDFGSIERVSFENGRSGWVIFDFDKEKKELVFLRFLCSSKWRCDLYQKIGPF